MKKSGTVPGVGMVHAPVALLPMSFPESQWKQACEVAPIFNELVDRVSQDGEFLQQSLSRLVIFSFAHNCYCAYYALKNVLKLNAQVSSIYACILVIVCPG